MCKWVANGYDGMMEVAAVMRFSFMVRHMDTLPFALIDLRCTTAYEQHVPGLAATSCPAGSTGGLMPALATG